MLDPLTELNNIDLMDNGREEEEKGEENFDAIVNSFTPIEPFAEKSYQCEYCVNCYASKELLDIHHFKAHNNATPYICNVCGGKFKNESNLTKHMTRQHQRPLKCRECVQHFQDENERQTHTELSHDCKKFHCFLCDFKFHFEESLNTHLECHSNEFPFECPDCSDVYDDVRLLQEHIQTKKKPPIVKMVDDDFNLSEFIKLADDYDCDFTNDDDDLNVAEVVEEEFICLICSASFTGSQDYIKHCEKHEKDTKMLEDDSKIYFNISLKTKTNRKAPSLEWQKKDNKKRPFKCMACDRSFTLASSLKLHNRRTHLGIRPYECQVCKCTFTQSSDLVKHLRKHTGDRPFVCSHCGLAFSQRRNLKNHTKMHTEAPSKCKYCAKEFAIDTSLIQHLKKHEGPTAKDCGFCQIPFTNEQHMNLHVKRFHADIKRHKCLSCDKTFTKSCDLVKHTRIHTGERPYTCDVCSMTFTHSTSLRNHKLVHTKEKPFQCSFCGQSFAFSGNLKVHIRSHTGEKPYPCQICQKSFARTANLNEHMKTHTGEKKHKCSECGKSFANSSTYSKHKKIHTGERPHKCQWCSKSFVQLAHLSKHVRIHTGEKPFACPICKKCFRRSDTLAAHSKTHRDKSVKTVNKEENNSLQVSIQHDENPPQIVTVDNFQTILLPTIQIQQQPDQLLQHELATDSTNQVMQEININLQPTFQITAPTGNVSYQQLIQWTTIGQ